LQINASAYELLVIEAVMACVAMAAVLGAGGIAATRRRRRMGRHPAPTFVFADLSGYTALTEERGDEAAAGVAREFRRTMCALSREHGARQVKSMADGVMIWAPDACAAVALAARAVGEVGTRTDLLPVRVGVHTGPAVMRGCDWYGSAVNVAARLAKEAEPGEALVSAATRAAAPSSPTLALGARRELTLRGVERPIAAWRVA
jgi:adenylate cyclase